MRFLSTVVASILGTFIALGLLLFFGFLFLLALAVSADQVPAVERGSVLVVTLDGGLPEQVANDPLGRLVSEGPRYDLHDVRRGLRMAAADDRIDAVWLQMRGAQAPLATLEEVRSALTAYKASGKPLVASADDFAMNENDYFVASAADAVYMAPEAFFEFNGFFLSVQFFERLFDKLDVQAEVVRAGRFKSAVEPFLRDDLSPENEEQLSALLETQNDLFVQTVAEARDMAPDEVGRLLSDVGLLSAGRAYDAGLLDGLLYLDEVRADLLERTGRDADDRLRELDLADYLGVPAEDAGLAVGDDGDVAVVFASGTIVSGESDFSPNPLMGGDMLGAETFSRAMREARESDQVRAVVVRIDSPGGSAPAADAMWRDIARTADVKPVLVSMGSMAASGGYWMAAAADTIVANPTTLTGSIGVFAVLFDLGGLFENKLGITFDAVRTSPYADMFSGVRPLSPAEEALLQQSIDSTYATFLRKVADGRPLTVAEVDSLAQGRIWTGREAQAAGLVDVLGGLDTAVDLAAERAGLAPGTYRVRELPRPQTLLEELSASLNAQAAAAWTRLATTPAERAVLQHAETLRRLAATHGTVQARLPAAIEVR